MVKLSSNAVPRSDRSVESEKSRRIPVQVNLFFQEFNTIARFREAVSLP